MKVLHVVEAMDRGGAEAMVVEHTRHAGPGVHVVVCALNRGGVMLERARAAGAETLVLGKGGLGLPAAVSALAREMRAREIEVVNGHNPTGGLWAALAARAAGVRAVVRTEHSLHYRGRHSAVYPLLEPVATALVRRVVCVCEAVRRSHAQRLRWAGSRFVVVPNGVSDDPPRRARDAVRAELGASPETRVVLAVGSLTRAKAHGDLLEAFARVASRRAAARLWIAGEGPLRKDLERRVAALGLADRVTLLGARDDVADLLLAADLFALSSVREGLPITLLEAMRAARPAVVTRIGGNPEAVEDGASGRVVAPGDVDALAAALETLIVDGTAAERMGQAARRRYEERFRAERMVRETEEVYAALLGARGPAVEAREARA